MKSTLLIFYGADGEAAKAEAKKLRNALTNVFLRHAVVFDGEDEKVNKIVFMPDVDPATAAKIKASYPGAEFVADGELAAVEPVVIPPNEITSKHRGGGRWYVVKGEEIISGPYAKADVDEAVQREKAITA